MVAKFESLNTEQAIFFSLFQIIYVGLFFFAHETIVNSINNILMENGAFIGTDILFTNANFALRKKCSLVGFVKTQCRIASYIINSLEVPLAPSSRLPKLIIIADINYDSCYYLIELKQSSGN